MKSSVLAALGAIRVQAATSNLKNTNWPKYETTNPSGAGDLTNLHKLGYGCIRNNYYFAFNQKIDTSGTIVA